MNKSQVINTVISATAGGIVGGAITFLTVRTTLKKKYEAIAEEEIHSVKLHYSSPQLKEEFVADVKEETYQETLKRLHDDLVAKSQAEVQDIVETEGYSDDSPEEPVLSIFESAVEETSELGYERIEGEPYLITQDEFEDDTDDFEKDTLTYYQGDDTLADSRDQPVSNVDMSVGDRHLDMFGNVGGDPDVIYIRNERLQTDFEVNLETGNYAQMVLGLDAEELGLVQPKARVKRMRDDD